MRIHGLGAAMHAVALVLLLASCTTETTAPPPASRSRVEAALTTIAALDRPGQDGLATVWDGNKYVQCRRMPDRSLRCEAAGSLMQPSLDHVLTAQRVARLSALGWRPDPSFGNYVRVFPANMPTDQVAGGILQALGEGYDADPAHLEVRSDWVASQPCPPRNGPTQNLAGMINDSPAMAATAVHGCAYRPQTAPSAQSAADLIGIYGKRVTAEIQRLRVNAGRRVFVVLETTQGYVQCQPETDGVYCEAQSAESWPMLAYLLTPERIAYLHTAGFADPGRAPNYWRHYPASKFDDGAVAHELLTILYQVYNYRGAPQLRFITEKGPA